ncbi:unnamed protein product [Absidia cylindrospora]
MYTGNSLSTYAVLSYLCSSLLGRPFDRSWYYPVIRYCAKYQCGQSDLLLLSFGLKFDSNDCIGAMDEFTEKELKRLFFKKYAVAIDIPNGTGSRPLELTPINCLEGTFGFVMSVQFPSLVAPT